MTDDARPHIVLDLGHGGRIEVAGSTPNRAVGPAGTLEKDLTLDLGRRVRRLLAARGVTASLTRDADVNLGLAERARAAGGAEADAFVSLHFNAAGDPRVQGSEAWVHPRGARSSRELARDLVSGVARAVGLAARGVHEGVMAVLDPVALTRDVPACLVELAFLTDPDEERRLGSVAYRERMAAGLAGGLERHVRAARRLGATRAVVQHEAREARDVFHQVPLVPQLTGMSCWAAGAAMIIGWRDCVDVDPEELARGSGHWADYRDGLHPRDASALARVWGLDHALVGALTAGRLIDLLEAHGPLWVGEASPGLHVVVVAGARGDGTPEGTVVRVLDPWPVGQGERYTVPFRQFLANLLAVADVAQTPAHILFAAAGGRGARRVSRTYAETSSVRWTRTPDGGSEGEREAGDAPSRLGAPTGLLALYQRPAPAATSRALWEDDMDSLGADDEDLGPPPLARNQVVWIEVRDPSGAVTAYTHEYPVKADPLTAGSDDPGVQITLPDLAPVRAREIKLPDLRKQLAAAFVAAKLFPTVSVNAKVATKAIAYEQPVAPGATLYLRILQKGGAIDPASGGYPVNDAGEVDLPRLGVVHVGGYTLGDAEQTLLKAIGDARLFPGAVVDLSLEALA
jgi:N-acetylmuramoyl-L-alanine amidase